jgi:hypothetical protein
MTTTDDPCGLDRVATGDILAELLRRGPRPAAVTGPVRCENWCVDGDGHGGATFAEDQVCYSEQHITEMTAMPPLTAGERTTERPIDYLEVYLSLRHSDVSGSLVGILHGKTDDELHLTLEEAARLVADLQNLLAQVTR